MSDQEPPEGLGGDGLGGGADGPDRPEPPESEPFARPPPSPLRSPLTRAPPGAPRPPPPPPPPPPPLHGRRSRRPAAPHRTRRASRRSFDFGGVLGGVFKVYGRMWLSIALLSLILIAPGSFALLKLQTDMLESANEITYGERDTDDIGYARRDAESVGRSALMMGGVAVFQMFMQMVLAGAITYLVVRYQQGRPVGVGEALARGLSRFFPIVGTMLLNLFIVGLMFVPAILLGGLADSAGLAIVLFLIALIPAGMYWYSVFVCGPVCAVEQLGPVASIKRSRVLSKGYRWYLVALTIVMALIGGAIGVMIQIPFLASQAGGNFAVQSMAQQLTATITEILVGTPLGAILLAMCYVELRGVKEGVDPEGIVAVFD